MELKRKPFQGVWNIIRFNWHFYLIAGVLLLLVFFFTPFFSEPIRSLFYSLSVLAVLSVGISLLASYYVYDCSALYQFGWLPDFNHRRVLNIHAGFDETSEIIIGRFPDMVLSICDFYNPQKHTEISIKRARRAYPPLANTHRVESSALPFEDAFFDYVLVILSAHEIRDDSEKIQFFEELKRITKPQGQIFVTEHPRDVNNFIAYNIGFFHFYPRAGWLKVFERAGLRVKSETKITPLLTSFVLVRNGNTP
jgi:SAM-dependent methyltransferase